MTALLDAIGRTIDAIGARLAATPEDRAPRQGHRRHSHGRHGKRQPRLHQPPRGRHDQPPAGQSTAGSSSSSPPTRTPSPRPRRSPSRPKMPSPSMPPPKASAWRWPASAKKPAAAAAPTSSPWGTHYPASLPRPSVARSLSFAAGQITHLIAVRRAWEGERAKYGVADGSPSRRLGSCRHYSSPDLRHKCPKQRQPQPSLPCAGDSGSAPRGPRGAASAPAHCRRRCRCRQCRPPSRSG